MSRSNSLVLIIICLFLLIQMASGLGVDVGPNQAIRFGDTVPFRVSVSDFTTGTITYIWDFGDGKALTGVSTTPEFLTIHRYSHKGTYTASLLVKTDAGSSASDTATITVANVEGSIVGWGWDLEGQATPPPGNDYVAIAAGGFHSLALKADGSIVGLGYDNNGQATPPPGNDYVAIAAGQSHSLALKSDGSIVGWGNDLGTPPAGNDYVAIAAGSSHSLALKADGSIVGWGNDNSGQATPPPGNDYVAITAGILHSLALKSDGSIVGWGNDNSGQATPPPGKDYVAIAAGGFYSLALKADGSIVHWGNDNNGQATPPPGNDYVAIASGRTGNVGELESSLALKADGSIVGWGNDHFGQATPPVGNDYVAITAGGFHSLALTSDITPPTTTLSTSGTHGTNDWYTSNVLITLSAIDNGGGSGLPKTEYNLDNTAWITYTVPFTLSDQGITTVNYRSTDNAGNGEETKSGTVKIDKTPPEVNITVPIAGGTYIQNEIILADWSVSDSVSDIATQSGTVPDGSACDTTLIGNKGFTVTAIDKAGNQNSLSVTYIIESQAQALNAVVTEVKDLNLPKGTENSLLSKIENTIDTLNMRNKAAAMNKLDASNTRNKAAAMNKLDAFINEVQAQRCKKIPCDEADHLIAMVQRIIDSIGR
jgi:hypothetical protein